MPRKRKPKQAESPAGQPAITTVGDALAEHPVAKRIIDAGIERSAPQLEPPAEEPFDAEPLTPGYAGKAPFETEALADKGHAARLKRPDWPPVPDDYRTVKGWEREGVRVLRRKDKTGVGVQFANGRHEPTPEEKSTLHALDILDGEERDRNKFVYEKNQKGTKIWERPNQPGDKTADNLFDAIKVAGGIAEGRGAGVER